MRDFAVTDTAMHISSCSLPEDKSSRGLRHLVRGIILTQRPGVLVGLAGHREMYKSCDGRPAHRFLCGVTTLPGVNGSGHTRVSALSSESALLLSSTIGSLLLILRVGDLLATCAAGLLQLLGLRQENNRVTNTRQMMAPGTNKTAGLPHDHRSSSFKNQRVNWCALQCNHYTLYSWSSVSPPCSATRHKPCWQKGYHQKSPPFSSPCCSCSSSAA